MTSIRAWPTVAVLVWALGLAIGCQRPERERELSSEGICWAGLTAFTEGRWDESERLLTEALGAGRLSPDLVSEALVVRAVVRSSRGEFVGAEQDLALAERGTTDVARLLAARAYVRQQQGRTKEAHSDWMEARRLDPTVEPFGS